MTTSIIYHESIIKNSPYQYFASQETQILCKITIPPQSPLPCSNLINHSRSLNKSLIHIRSTEKLGELPISKSSNNRISNILISHSSVLCKKLCQRKSKDLLIQFQIRNLNKRLKFLRALDFLLPVLTL